MSEVVLVAEVEFVPGREEEALAALRELCERPTPTTRAASSTPRIRSLTTRCGPS